MIDKHSGTWRDIIAWAGKELPTATDRIETLGVGPAETENLRGRIACLRELLAMQDDPEERVVVPTVDYNFQAPDDA